MARSNRQLTQFAVHRIGCILDHGTGVFPASDTAGNTEVSTRFNEACVKLFGKEILSIKLDGGKILGITVHSGDFYDSKGRPSRTTRERLNGLLDYLGIRRLIPDGVRVFIREDGGCYVGKNAACKALDASNPAVTFLAHPTNLVMS